MSKKIVVELNRKSIKDAIKQLKDSKKVIQDQLMPEYMQRSAEWIRDRANELVSLADIGENVKEAIKDYWFIEKISNSQMVLYNISEKAAYVEFGVGIIGQSSQHPNANNAGYEYNVKSEYKFGQGFWQFNVEDRSWLDIPEDAIVYQNVTNSGETIITQGTEGVWYLYNAVEDFKLREQKRLWEELTRKYLG